jgi:ketosteroid isomerase-like protein
MTISATDYDAIMRANLVRVFGERDHGRRMMALRDLYAEDAVLYEPDASVKGHAAISAAVTALLASLPPEFAFVADGAAVAGNRIHALYVFIDS